jgi:hypothetical protein
MKTLIPLLMIASFVVTVKTAVPPKKKPGCERGEKEGAHITPLLGRAFADSVPPLPVYYERLPTDESEKKSARETRF